MAAARRLRPLGALLAIAAVALLALTTAGPTSGASAPGHITYRVGDEGPLMRVEARAGGKQQNVTAGLDRRFPGGGDAMINQSPDGRSLLVVSQRFGCTDTPCLAVVNSELTKAQKVLGGTINPEGYSAVGNGGRVVVFPMRVGDDRIDLFVSRRSGSRWSPPRNVTAKSDVKVHILPSVATDAKRVLHSCGETSEPSEGPISICESRLDGSGTTVRVTGAQGRPPADENFETASLYHPDYLGAGSGIVFESQWCCEGESLWYQAKPGATPRHVAGASVNNVAPCGLPNGRVVSLDLTRAAGGGAHELMLTTTKSRKRTYVLGPGVDVRDAGLGCGR